MRKEYLNTGTRKTHSKRRTEHFEKYVTPSCVIIYTSRKLFLKMVRFLVHPVVALIVIGRLLGRSPLFAILVWVRHCVPLPAVIHTQYISTDAQLDCQVLSYSSAPYYLRASHAATEAGMVVF